MSQNRQIHRPIEFHEKTHPSGALVDVTGTVKVLNTGEVLPFRSLFIRHPTTGQTLEVSTAPFEACEGQDRVEVPFHGHYPLTETLEHLSPEKPEAGK